MDSPAVTRLCASVKSRKKVESKKNIRSSIQKLSRTNSVGGGGKKNGRAKNDILGMNFAGMKGEGDDRKGEDRVRRN